MLLPCDYQAAAVAAKAVTEAAELRQVAVVKAWFAWLAFLLLQLQLQQLQLLLVVVAAVAAVAVLVFLFSFVSPTSLRRTVRRVVFSVRLEPCEKQIARKQAHKVILTLLNRPPPSLRCAGPPSHGGSGRRRG